MYRTLKIRRNLLKVASLELAYFLAQTKYPKMPGSINMDDLNNNTTG
jgi:hypothetical protein